MQLKPMSDKQMLEHVRIQYMTKRENEVEFLLPECRVEYFPVGKVYKEEEDYVYFIEDPGPIPDYCNCQLREE